MIDDKISLEDYHALPAMSAHNLMDIDEDPYIAVHDKENPEEKTPTVQKRLDLGTNIHTGIEVKTDENFFKSYHLEPEKRNDIILRSEKTGILTKAGKLQLEELKKEVAPKKIITQEEWEVIAGCRDAAWSDTDAKPYLEKAKFELSGFANINGVDVKARPDLDNYESHRTLVDIKTRQKWGADVKKWTRDWWKYKTYIQAGLQMLVWEDLGMPCKEYYYLLVEIKPPYKVEWCYLSPELIQRAKDLTLEVIVKWQKYLDGSLGYGKPEQMTALPWMRSQDQTI